MPHIRNPNPCDLHRREQPLPSLALKSNGAYIQENHRAVENGNCTLKGLKCKLAGPGTQHKSSSWKSTLTICEGDSLVKPKEPELEALVDAIFAFMINLANI